MSVPTEPPDLPLSVLVVSYNTRELTLECLRSLRAETETPEHEVVVVDNASEDGSAAAIEREHPDVHLIALDENVGFGAANNLAAERARGRRLLLLNPDTVVLDRAVTRLHEFAEANPTARVWGGRTVFEDRSLNRGSCWGAPTVWSTLCLAMGWANRFRDVRWLHPEGLGAWRRDTVRVVDIVSGCFLSIDADLWRELGGFHPDFFMYGEDADLCLRARSRGARPTICPDATIVHLGGASEPVKADKMVRLFTAKAQLFRRHWGAARAVMGVRLLDLWAALRVAGYGVLRFVRPRYREPLAQWRDVWSRRSSWRGVRPSRPARRG